MGNQIETLQLYFGQELANKTTFDNLPLELDWSRMKRGEQFIEVPLVTPIVAFEVQSTNFESRLIIPKKSPEKYTFVSLEANFDFQDSNFKEIVEDRGENKIVTWIELDNEYNSLGFHKFNNNGNPNMKMDEEACATLYYYERTCYYNGSSLVGCTSWELVDSYEVCNGGGGGGGSSYHTTYANYVNNQALNEIASVLDLTNEEKEVLVNALAQFRQDCTNEQMYSYFKSNSLKFGFSSNISSENPGGYDPITGVITFDGINNITAQVLQEELFHGYQDKLNNNKLYTILNDNNYGRSNIEFESKFYRDILYVKSDQACCLTIQGSEGDSYYEWLNEITNDGTAYPISVSQVRNQYFYYLEIFKETYPSYNYPTDPQLDPTTAFSLFHNSNCN